MLLHLCQSPTLVVSSVEMVMEIMQNQDLVFANIPSTTAAIALPYRCSDIAFPPYGEYWRQLRKICVQELLSVQSVHSFKKMREEEVDAVIQIISNLCSTRERGKVVINISKLLLTLSTNIISRCALDAKFESIHGNKFGQLSKKHCDVARSF